MESENRKTILFALAADLFIAVAKLAGGVLTGSSALFAEAAHSIADCLNQIFLLVSLSLGKRRPDEAHPFGHGTERFFWALMAAVMIFVGGAIVMESVGGALSSVFDWRAWPTTLAILLEEGMEMAGVGLFIYSLLDYAARELPVLSFVVRDPRQPPS